MIDYTRPRVEQLTEAAQQKLYAYLKAHGHKKIYEVKYFLQLDGTQNISDNRPLPYKSLEEVSVYLACRGLKMTRESFQRTSSDGTVLADVFYLEKL